MKPTHLDVAEEAMLSALLLSLQDSSVTPRHLAPVVTYFLDGDPRKYQKFRAYFGVPKVLYFVCDGCGATIHHPEGGHWEFVHEADDYLQSNGWTKVQVGDLCPQCSRHLTEK